MIKLNNETALMLHLSSDLYKLPAPTVEFLPINKSNITLLLQISIKNKLGFYISKKLIDNYSNQLNKESFSLVNNFVLKSEAKIKNLSEATRILTNYLDNYVIHKTFRGYDVIPNDIDVIIPNIETAIKKLKIKKTEILDVEDHQTMVIIRNQKVHLHDKITWADSIFFDADLVWTKPQTKQLWNNTVKIPNVDVDFLIYMAHMNFEPLHFTLSDFIYICKIAPFVDWNFILNQSTKYHWVRTLAQTLNLFDMFHHTIYAGKCPFEKVELLHDSCDLKEIVFPKSIPRWQIINAFLEKRAFGYVLKALTKSAKIIATGDTYNEYYVPPEQA